MRVNGPVTKARVPCNNRQGLRSANAVMCRIYKFEIYEFKACGKVSGKIEHFLFSFS
jgi:hypothetical protein